MLELTSRLLHSLEASRAGLPSLEQRALLVSHEIADVGYRIVRSDRTPEDKDAIMADIGVDLGDAIVQLEMLILDLGLSPEYVKALGLQHTFERFKDFWGDGKRCTK